MNSNITGDATRQAVECLGGYAYQIYASALAWATLMEGEVLHLEVAEDFAISTHSALNAVQVKRTNAKVTSNSAGIIAAIDSLVTLTLDNPDRIVTLRYLTTSEIGTEKRKEDRVDDQPFILAWSNLRRSGDLQALRKRIAKLSLSQRTTDFITDLSDSDLRNRVLRKLWFDCGQPDFSGLHSQLNEALVEIGNRKGIFATESEKARPAIIEKILLCSSENGRRQLTRSEFIRLFDQQSTTTIPNALIRSALFKNHPDFGVRTSIADIRPLIEPVIGDPGFSNQAPRDKLLKVVTNCFQRGVVWLHAGTGYGKTLLARTLVYRDLAKGGMLRLRNMPPQQIALTLDRARSELLLGNYDTIIIDDVAGFEIQAVATSVRTLVDQALGRQQSLIFTSYFRPNDATMTALGISSSSCVEIEKLTDDDLIQMVSDAPAMKDTWAKYVRFGSSNGHPQLSHALVEGLRRRGWPQSDLAKLPAILGSDQAINQTKDEIRRRLLHELPENTRLFAYRLSLITSTFDIHLAKAVAEVPGSLPAPGELLDSLVGPWIDKIANDEFQLSPLLAGSGSVQLGMLELQNVHAAIANALIRSQTIDSGRIDQLVMSGLAGKAQGALMGFVAATLSEKAEMITMLAANCLTLTMLRTDRPIFPANARLSIQLRMIQALFNLAEGKPEKFRAALRAFEDELCILNDDDAALGLRLTLGGKLLLMPQLAEAYPEFPMLIVSTVECAKVLGVDSKYEFAGQDYGYSDVTMSMGTALFIQQTINIKSLTSLGDMLKSLAALPAEDRLALVPPRDSIRYNPEQIIKSIWVKAKGEPNYISEDYAQHCMLFATTTAELGERDFSIAAIVTAAVIRSEEVSQHEDALAILDQAQLKFGSDFAIERAKAGIYFNTKDFQRQIQTIEPILPYMMEEGWIERAYLFRETAIAHGQLGDWNKCFERFDEARHFASKSKIEQMSFMEIGLQADSAVALWKGGSITKALQTISAALTRIESIDPSSGFRQRALVRLVRFTGFWMYAEFKRLKQTIHNIEADMVIGCNSNPNPHGGLDEMPVGPVKMIKYLLAQIDIATGQKAGIWKDEVSRFSDQDAVLSMECMLFFDAFQSALKLGSPEGIVEFGPQFIDAKHAYKQRALAEKEIGELESGRLPRVSAEVWEAERHDVASQIAVFMLNAIASQHADRLTQFLVLNEASGRPLIYPPEVGCLQRGDPVASNALQSIFGAVGSLRDSLAHGTRPIVPNLFITTLRLVDAIRMAMGFATCIEFVANWTFEKWEEAIREERFRFNTPLLAEQEIYKVLHCRERDLSSLSRLVLATHRYVGISLTAPHIAQLRKLASGQAA